MLAEIAQISNEIVQILTRFPSMSTQTAPMSDAITAMLIEIARSQQELSL